jgi:tetratricopeptide (TPR) repeat protein
VHDSGIVHVRLDNDDDDDDDNGSIERELHEIMRASMEHDLETTALEEEYHEEDEDTVDQTGRRRKRPRPRPVTTEPPEHPLVHDPLEPPTSVHDPRERPLVYDPRERPPVHDPRERPPVHDSRERPPVHDPRERPPVYDPRERPPVYDPRERPPVHDPRQRPPVYDPRERPPVYDPRERSPVHDPRERPPEHDPRERPPVYDPRERPPVLDPRERPPVHDPRERPPVHDPRERPPVYDPRERPFTSMFPDRRRPVNTETESIYMQAMSLYRRNQLDEFYTLINEKVVSGRNYDILTKMHCMANDLQLQNNFEESLINYNALIAALQRIYGDRDHRTLRIMIAKTNLLFKMNRGDESLREFDRIIQISEIGLGQNDDLTVSARNNKNLLLLHMGRYDESRRPEHEINEQYKPYVKQILDDGSQDITDVCIKTLTKFQDVVDFAENLFVDSEGPFIRSTLENRNLDRRQKLLTILDRSQSTRQKTKFELNTLSTWQGANNNEKIVNRLLTEIPNLLAVTDEYYRTFYRASEMSLTSDKHEHDEPHDSVHDSYRTSIIQGHRKLYRTAIDVVDNVIEEKTRIFGKYHAETKRAKHYKIVLLENMIETAKSRNPIIVLIFEMYYASRLTFPAPRNTPPTRQF